MDDWVFGTILRHTFIDASVMFICAGADRLDWWWGMWLQGDAQGQVVRLSGRRSEPRLWVRS